MSPSRREAVAAAKVLATYLGLDLKDPGLKRTPKRLVAALEEMTVGRHDDVVKILGTTFKTKSDEMIVLDRIEFTSLCEHHLLPFRGHARVGYIPEKGVVVGLSKLARLVDAFSRRPQIQERMTQQIATTLNKHVACRGVGVVVVAEHMCMAVRGARKPGATMKTSSMLGVFRDDPSVRAEFLQL